MKGLGRRALLAAASLVLVGCSPLSGGGSGSGGDPTIGGQNGGELRTDLEPITKRIPALADARSAKWRSGTLGDSRVPGPSTYWLHAVVELPQALYDEARAKSSEDAELPSSFSDSLGDLIPKGKYLSGEALNSFFAPSEEMRKRFAKVSAYLAAGEPTLVVAIISE